MKKGLHILLAGLMAAMMFSAVSFAEDVFVTKYGKKYHKEDSRFIKGKEVKKMSREEAESKGYKPSSDFDDEEKMSESEEESAGQ